MFEAVAWEQALWSASLAQTLSILIGAFLLNSRQTPFQMIFIARVGAILLLASQVAYLRAATIAMTDTAGDGLLDAMSLVFTHTHFGMMLQLSAVATVIVLALLFVPGLSSSGVIWRTVYGASVIALALARAGAGHAIDHGMVSGAVFNDTVHILAACAWVGVAISCCIAAYRWQAWSHAEQQALVKRVSLVATWALLAVGLTGIFNVLRMIDIGDISLDTPYMRMLAFKLGGVTVAMMLGAYNRWVSMPRMALHPGGAGRRFVQVLLVETLVLLLVMTAATSLGTMMPPM
jgi:putative copper resistance protein D